MPQPSVSVSTTLAKCELLKALRALTINARRFDPSGWALADADDFEAAAGLIRREIAEAEAKRRAAKVVWMMGDGEDP
jgi:hypothetical protein